MSKNNKNIRKKNKFHKNTCIFYYLCYNIEGIFSREECCR